jgi:hypothetical protein
MSRAKKLEPAEGHGQWKRSSGLAGDAYIRRALAQPPREGHSGATEASERFLLKR